ncbi:zf-HC2 domain-containing protein [Pseudonocardia sp. TRM90224]|uniref:zf-HC2 domain-containing protein n=1 Tax=Pseudonocardia sp. TRM90224 TaxID=2812678 RepID=UPI001E5569D3|nr:zf-HC2 domain-containing protein [Pseudonocardia sp. TRM90224]
MSSRRRFSVTVPDWGQDHLSSDAIVAYVDNELAAGPHTRAARHVSTCRECLAQVVAQGQARSALRSAEVPSLPSSLLNSLRSIPQETELPPPPAGLAMTADGQFVALLRPERPAPPAAPSAPAVTPHAVDERATSHRRLKIGAGAAVSGLALGAMALAAPSFSTAAPTPEDPARGVFNGPVLGGTPVVDARLQFRTESGAPTSERPAKLADK